MAPRRVYDAKKTRVLATVAGFGTKKSTRSVSLMLNGRVIETKQVEVPENGRATVEFLSLDVPYGRNKGEVQDRYRPTRCRPTTRFYFSVERSDPRHALFVQESAGSRGLLYFKAALEAAGQSAFEIDPVTVDQAANVSAGQVRLRGAVRCGRRAADVRERAAQLCARRRQRAGSRSGTSRWARSKVPVTGDAIAGGALLRPRGRAVPDRGVARSVASLDPEGRPLGGREVLPGDPRGAGQGARGGAAHRPDAAAARSADRRGPRSGFRLHLRQYRQRFSRCTPPSCRSSSRRRATWAAWMPGRPQRAGGRRSPNCAIPRRRAPRWMCWIPRASARFPWKRPPRRRIFSSPWPASTISAGPTGATNWWR